MWVERAILLGAGGKGGGASGRYSNITCQRAGQDDFPTSDAHENRDHEAPSMQRRTKMSNAIDGANLSGYRTWRQCY